MTKFNWRLVITLFVICGIMSGCGFKLRGTVNLAATLHNVYIASDNPYGAITLQLKQILTRNGVTIADKPSNDIITLTIAQETYNTSIFSESASSKTKQYTLMLALEYSLQNNKGTTLFGPKTIHTQEIYTVNESSVLTTTTQEQNVRTTLQKRAVYLLLDQLTSPVVATAISQHTPAPS